MICSLMFLIHLHQKKQGGKEGERKGGFTFIFLLTCFLISIFKLGAMEVRANIFLHRYIATCIAYLRCIYGYVLVRIDVFPNFHSS